jgi:CDGSH-type Zn-finger protein
MACRMPSLRPSARICSCVSSPHGPVNDTTHNSPGFEARSAIAVGTALFTHESQ